MSYKKIEDIQYLYENVDGKESDIEDLSNLIVEKLISEGYSENAIHSFMETADEFALQEKIMQLDENKVAKGIELLRKFGSRFIRKKPQQLNLNLGSKSSALDKGKEVVKKGVEVVKKNPKASAVVGTSTLVGTSVATSNRGNNKDTNTDTETKAKPGTFKDSQGKEFPTTDTIRGTTRKELSTERDPIINRRGRTTGYTKSEKDLENEKIDKQVDKYVADKKAPINKDLTIDKSAEGKAKYDAKKAERIAKETPKVATPKVDAPAPKPEKITARTQMRQRNIDRFGADKVNALMDKQKAFKSMQAKSMMPGAKPGAAKAEFAKDFPNSNVAKDLKKSKRVTQVMDLESYDAFDIVLGYLSESGQVDSMDEALYIMMEMDAATIQGIVRDFEMLTEEEADRMKDERLEKYGIGHDGSDRKAGSGGSSDSKKPKGKTNLQKETEKKHGKGKSPLDVAKANIVAKYGKGAIAPSKKKKK